MEPTYLEGDIARQHGESPKEHYERLIATRVAINFELSVPRCIDCEYRDQSMCRNYNNEIPEGLLYEQNECPAHSPDIPF